MSRNCPDLNALFSLQVLAANLPHPVREYKFHPTRKWRFDFAWFDYKVAVEIQGGTYSVTPGRHNRPVGYREDCIKANEAALAGWTVLRGDSQMVKSGALLATVEKAINQVTGV